MIFEISGLMDQVKLTSRYLLCLPLNARYYHDICEEEASMSCAVISCMIIKAPILKRTLNFRIIETRLIIFLSVGTEDLSLSERLVFFCCFMLT